MGTLQSAYEGGNTISTQASSPVKISGPEGIDCQGLLRAGLAEVGSEFENFIIKEEMKGATLQGDPEITPTTVYVPNQWINFGGTEPGGNGKLTYDIPNLINTKMIKVETKFRFTPWNTDGNQLGFFIGGYGFTYYHNPQTHNTI